VGLWRRDFANTVNGSDNLRGLAVTLAGQAAMTGGAVWLSGNADRPALRPTPLLPLNKVQWDPTTGARALHIGDDIDSSQCHGPTAQRLLRILLRSPNI